MSSVVKNKVFPVSIESLYRAITDFERYPEFLPEVVSAKKIGSSDSQCDVQFELEVVKRFQYTLSFSMKAPNEVRWKLKDSNFFKNNDGAWVLKSISPTETEVHYELDVSFGFLVPGWISKKLTEVSLPKMFDNFEAQAKKY